MTVRPYSTREERQGAAGRSQSGVAGGVGEGANFEFGEAGFGERRENSVLLGGALAGAKVAGVVGVHAVGDG